jgi:hypothetical protein
MHLKEIGLESMDRLIWLRIRTSSGCREHDKENAAFHKRLGISSQRERLTFSNDFILPGITRSQRENFNSQIHIYNLQCYLSKW